MRSWGRRERLEEVEGWVMRGTHDVDDEVVRVARGKCEDDDEADGPVYFRFRYVSEMIIAK